MLVNLPAKNAAIFAIPKAGAQQSFAVGPGGQATITANGAHVDADFVQVVAAGAGPAPTVHLTGDVTCGSTVAF